MTIILSSVKIESSRELDKEQNYDKEEHKELLELPNWDNEVFKEITGIDAEKEIENEAD